MLEEGRESSRRDIQRISDGPPWSVRKNSKISRWSYRGMVWSSHTVNQQKFRYPIRADCLANFEWERHSSVADAAHDHIDGINDSCGLSMDSQWCTNGDFTVLSSHVWTSQGEHRSVTTLCELLHRTRLHKVARTAVSPRDVRALNFDLLSNKNSKNERENHKSFRSFCEKSIGANSFPVVTRSFIKISLALYTRNKPNAPWTSRYELGSA